MNSVLETETYTRGLVVGWSWFGFVLMGDLLFDCRDQLQEQ